MDEICDVARRQLATGGPGAVTWRVIAREVGMGPASLYTYFDGLDALFTELIVRSYRSIAAAVAAAIDAFTTRPAGDRLMVGPLAYRHWARRHRAEFNLVFTDQLPGFVAPPGGPTVDAQTAIFRPIAGVLAEVRAARDGVDPEVLGDPVTATGDALDEFLGLWGLFHGLVILEVNHHLDWVDPASTFESRLRWAIDALDLPPASPDTVDRFDRWCSEQS